MRAIALIEMLEDFAIPIGLVVVLVVLVALLSWSEDRSLAQYRERCLASGLTRQQCDLMVEAKQNADSAEMLGAAAIGFAAGRR